MSNWKVNVIHIARPEETRRLWKWTPLPPLAVLRECLKERTCTTCHGPTGPFLFIGKLPDGPYMAFQRPIQLVRMGTLGLVITPQVAAAPAPAPQKVDPGMGVLKNDLPETPPHKPRILRVVDRPKKRVKKPAKKGTKPAPKKPTKTPMKKVAKKATKPAPKKTPRRRRSP